MAVRGVRGALVAGGVATLGAASAFGSISFTGSGSGFGSGGLHTASALFDVVNSTHLQVTLTNTGPEDVLQPADVLTAIFFDISGSSVGLTPSSALLANGSVVYYDPDGQPAGGVVGGEWAYKSGITNGPTAASYGISSTGLNIFGPTNLFPGPDLSPPPDPDGTNYGLLSAGDDTTTGNNGIKNSGGLIKNAVVFDLSGLPANFDLTRVNNVFFLYGTKLNEGGFNGPTPGTLAILGVGGLALGRRRR